MEEINSQQTEEVVQKVPKKRGRKPKNKGYFVQEQEEAFRRFLVCENETEKNRIFEKQIYPALCKMIECLIRRYYLFSVDETYEDTFYDTLSFLITKINNFDPNKKCKAYSYCGTICKNYLILKRTQSIKKQDHFLSYQTVYGNAEKDNRVEEEKKDWNFNTQLINRTREEIQEILDRGFTDKKNLTNNEIKLGNALLEILDHWNEMIDENGSNKFNKMSLLYFMKEYTLCSTNEVRSALKLYKNLYLFTKQDLLKE